MPSQVPSPPRKCALLIGINYERTPLVLRRPQEDALLFYSLLIELRGYAKDDVTLMLDVPDTSLEYRPHLVPTRENILREIDTLLQGSQPGDHIVFYFAGHACQIPNYNHTEEDDLDECILPVDSHNIIVDDELKIHLVDPLKAGSIFVAVFDTCHSGSMLDLPHIHCNQVYIPWMSRQRRKTGSRWNFLTRNNAIFGGTFLIPSLKQTTHFYDLIFSKRNDNSTRTSNVNDNLKRKEDSTDTTKPSTEYLQVIAPSIPICSSPSWLTDSFCDGQCHERSTCQNLDSTPYVVCLSATKDSQIACETKNISMTTMLVDVLREYPEMSLREMMTRISHQIRSMYVGIHKMCWQHGRKVENPSGSKLGLYSVIHNDMFQDPQISSLRPLDLDIPLHL